MPSSDKEQNPYVELCNIRQNPLLVLGLEEVDQPSVFRIHQEIDSKKFDTLDVILQTRGGDIHAAFKIAKLLHAHAKNINILIPWYAKSAGTLICLVANKLIMSDLSEVGPLDTQVPETRDKEPRAFKSALNANAALRQLQTHTLETLHLAAQTIFGSSGLSMAEAVELAVKLASESCQPLYAQLNPTTIGEYARLLEVGSNYSMIILTRYLDWKEEPAKEVVNHLVYGYPEHGFVIDRDELRRLNINVEDMDTGEERFLTIIALHLYNLDRKEESLIKLLEPKPKTKIIPDSPKRKYKVT